MRLIIAISGATGGIYGIKLLEYLSKLDDVETHLIVSKWAKETISLETGFTVEQVEEYADFVYENDNIGATVASGSFRHDGMVVIPCSMKTLAAISNGYTSSLISRAADVTIKEQRKLILSVRETPLSPIHLENMLKLSRIGTLIMPPIPSYYNKPKTIDDIVNQFIGRVLDHFHIENELCKRWEPSR